MSSHLKKCADDNIYVKMLPLRTPIDIELAMREGGQPKTFSAKQKVRLSTTLSLPTGNLRLCNVEYLVFEEYMPEVLLSRPVLMSLGFNLDTHLANVRESYHNADFSWDWFRSRGRRIS